MNWGERVKEDKNDNFLISSTKRIKWNIISQNSHGSGAIRNGLWTCSRYICHLVNGIKRFAIMNIQIFFGYPSLHDEHREAKRLCCNFDGKYPSVVDKSHLRR